MCKPKDEYIEVCEVIKKQSRMKTMTVAKAVRCTLKLNVRENP